MHGRPSRQGWLCRKGYVMHSAERSIAQENVRSAGDLRTRVSQEYLQIAHMLQEAGPFSASPCKGICLMHACRNLQCIHLLPSRI